MLGHRPSEPRPESLPDLRLRLRVRGQVAALRELRILDRQPKVIGQLPEQSWDIICPKQSHLR